jgi:SPP1 family phage portal protein
MQFKNITEVNANTIKVLIDKSKTEHEKIRNLYERYKQTDKGVPVLTREYKIGTEKQTNKINNKLPNDFVGEIVDMKVGFFCGVPISYTLDKTDYQQERNIIAKTIDKVKSVFTNKETKTEVVISPEYDENLQIINDFNDINSVDDLDLETAKRMTICGSCGRLLYTENEGEIIEKAKLIEPWEVIYIGDSVECPDAVIRYYDTITYDTLGKEVTTSYAELYTSTQVDYYVKTKEGAYVQDKPSVSYYWGGVPLIGFLNNEEFLGDCNKVLGLIDAYDKLTSDMSSESESWRLAYMIFNGVSISAEDIKKAQQTGAFSLPEGATAGFLTKEINNLFQENFLKLLEQNIYRFSETPNLNDQSFAGTITGVALKYKFRSFEDKCKRAELKFKKSLSSQYTMLCKVWADRGTVIDPMSIDFIFTRNYPQNLVEEIQILRDSKGIISEETRFSLVSFIADPQKEIEKLKSEETENLDNFIQRNEAMKSTSDNKDDNSNDNQNDNKNAISNQVKEEVK